MKDVTKMGAYFVLGGGALVCALGTLLVLVEESIPGVWAIPLAIITLILGGLLFLRARKLREQRTKKFKDLAEQMGMSFSAEVDDALIESLSVIATLMGTTHSPTGQHWTVRGRKITNMLYGDAEQLGLTEDVEVRIFDYKYTKGDLQHLEQTVIYFRSPQLNLPTFTLQPEVVGDKINPLVQTFRDIDFESGQAAVQFSGKYLLKGKDERKVRALFTDEVLAFFASKDSVVTQGSGDQLVLFRCEGVLPNKHPTWGYVLTKIEPDEEAIRTFLEEGLEVFRVFI